MNNFYFLEVANYNIWANNIVHNWLLDITEDQWSQTIVSSFGSIAATALHIAGAERIWLDRFKKSEKPIWLPNAMQPILHETLAEWSKASEGLIDFVSNCDDSKMNETLSFKRINGDSMNLSMQHALAHVFNHSTYHRGQLLLMLKQVGYEKASGTDMLIFFKGK